MDVCRDATRRFLGPRCCALSCIVAIALAVCGCDRGPQLAPVHGKVLLDGKPLTFGSVTFQPTGGHPARGTIQPDGAFSLSTFEPEDGATVGANRIRVTCTEAQRPNAQIAARGGEVPLGSPLIPPKYSFYDSSGLKAEVKPGENEPVVINLTSK